MGLPLTVGAPTVAWIVGLWIVAVDNMTFWRTVWGATDRSTPIGLLSLLALGALAWVLVALLARLLCWRAWGKPALAVLLVVSALAAHFIDGYGIVVDKGMVRNVLETDAREVADLLSWQLLLDVSLRGLLPAALLLSLRIEHAPWRAAAAGIAAHTAVFAAFAALVLAVFFAQYADVFRNHRELRHVFTPTNVLNGLYGNWKQRAHAAGALTPVGIDARRDTTASAKPLVLVLVVGESARAASFSLGRYERDTNHALEDKQVVYFPAVSACGTDTATSLPCMFSDLGSARFSPAAALGRENVLDVVARAGVAVRWLDNNSGCKDVCRRVPTRELWNAGIGGSCDAIDCRDEVLLRELLPTLAGVDGDALVVLHQKGSHGPAYHRRYPPTVRRFEPTCETNQIQRCDRQALLNTYDNSIAYTSELLARTIDLLAAQSGRIDPVLLYVSDHGESLGEKNLYLHGMPRVLAPAEQTEVPMLAWVSQGAQRRLRLGPGALERVAAAPYSHDNLFHTLLGAFGVQTSAYRPQLDILAAARDAADDEAPPASSTTSTAAGARGLHR